MALIMEIMKTIAQPIGELAVWFEETYQVEVSETVAKWRELTGMNITVKEGEVFHDEVQSLNVDSTKNVKSKKIPKTKDVCQHIFLSGQKVGEQCTTKPKGGASYCSAHRPKDSVKSVKETKPSKKKEVKKVEKIDSEFGSDSEEAPVNPFDPVGSKGKPFKVLFDQGGFAPRDIRSERVKEPKKSKKEKVEKAPKEEPKPEDDMTEDSDGEPISRAVKYSDAYMDAMEANTNKEKYRKAPVVEDSDDDLSEPQKPVKPLLKKKTKTASAKPLKKVYDTDEEVLDKDLDLSDDD